MIMCDMDCKYEERGECTKETIAVEDGCCCDYEEIQPEDMQKRYPDYFYACCENNNKTINSDFVWQKRRGRKLIWNDIVLYEEYCGGYTIGRIGIYIGHDLEKLTDVSTILLRLKEEESKRELSPLYNSECKYPIVLSRELEREQRDVV